MIQNGESENSKTEQLSLDTIDVSNIDFANLDSVNKYTVFAGDAVAKKILEDPAYLNERNDIADLALKNIAVTFDRIKNGEAITGVSEANRRTLDYYELLMAGEASISGEKDPKHGAMSLEGAVYGGNVLLSEAEHIAKHIIECDSLIGQIFSDPNVEVDPGYLPYLANNTIPIIESLKRDNEQKKAA